MKCLKSELAHDFEKVLLTFGEVDVENAQSYDPKDKEVILEKIREEFGITEANQTITATMVKSLLKYVLSSIDLGDPDGFRLLFLLIARKASELAPQDAFELLSAQCPTTGWTLLHYAVSYGSVNATQVILNAAGPLAHRLVAIQTNSIVLH